MSTVSTAQILVGPFGVGPFNAPDWRIGTTFQLVEGGTNGPYWLATYPQDPTQQGKPDFLLINSLQNLDLVKTLILFLAISNADKGGIEQALAKGLLTRSERGIHFPQPWNFNAPEFAEAVSSLSKQTQLGIVSLSDMSLIGDDFVAELRRNGFTCQIFMPADSINWQL